MKMICGIVFFISFGSFAASAGDVGEVKCDNYPAGENIYKICFINVDGINVPHGKYEIINEKGVAVLEQYYERGEEVGFLINRADDGKVLKVCYFSRGKNESECIEL
ncbi:hypothetical protein [Microbulbifer sp. TRSA005]|uniref:hypothetical protein n=1 Tax=Microbulbifer sp. TRSA005 TaxID=3243383 RepID=UPI00403A766A